MLSSDSESDGSPPRLAGGGGGGGAAAAAGGGGSATAEWGCREVSNLFFFHDLPESDFKAQSISKHRCNAQITISHGCL